MTRKLGLAVTKLDKELGEAREALREQLKERTRYSRSLSKELWNYYNHIRTMMGSMEVAIPLATESKATAINDDDDYDDEVGESSMSDSYLAEDLGRFFSSESDIEEEEWPSDRYDTLIKLTKKVDLSEVCQLVTRAPIEAKSLTLKWQKERNSYKEKYQKIYQESKNKIAVRK